MDEIIERYEELYEDMANSGNKDKMMAFGDAERWAFKKMREVSPKDAQCWLDKLEAMHWKNYLSKHEAEEITSKLINQNGRIGAHWNYDTFKGAVESLGGKVHEKPYYNCYALWATANMIYSDHALHRVLQRTWAIPTQRLCPMRRWHYRCTARRLSS